MTNGENSFIFTGDAESISESQMVNSGINLLCDVLSIGHHGSATSTSYEFLQVTLPESAVISCGVDNPYGHPDADTMDKLASMEIDVYRNDIQGTIIAHSDGALITWNQEPCNDYSPGDNTDLGTQPQAENPVVQEEQQVEEQAQPDEQVEEEQQLAVMVWKSATGSKYHSINNCGNMNPNKATQITLEQAGSMGLGRCSNCW